MTFSNGFWFSLVGIFLNGVAANGALLESRITPFGVNDGAAVELKNDGYVETGSSAYVQLGFVKGEMAGVWVKVPTTTPLFKVDFFRVLIAESRNARLQAFFRMGSSAEGKFQPAIPGEIQNAVSLTAGPYWNDIPVQGASGQTLGCLRPGALVGAALEFTHDGAPSVFRDGDGLSNPLANVLFAVPGGWNYSSALGLTGDWVLRVVGHVATEAECGS